MAKGKSDYYRIYCKLKVSPLCVSIDVFEGEFICFLSTKVPYPNYKCCTAYYKQREFTFSSNGKKFTDSYIYLHVNSLSNLAYSIYIKFPSFLELVTSADELLPNKRNTIKILEHQLKCLKSNHQMLLDYQEQANRIKLKRSKKMLIKNNYISKNKWVVKMYKTQRQSMIFKSCQSEEDKRVSVICKKADNQKESVAKTLLNIDKYKIKKERVLVLAEHHIPKI